MYVEVRVVLLLLLLPAVCLPAEPPVEDLKGTVMYTCIHVRDNPDYICSEYTCI